MERLVTAQATALVRNSERFAQVLNGKGDVGHLFETQKLDNVGKVAFNAAKEERAR